MSQKNWNTDNIADQTGRVIVVTGASSGLGKEISKVLLQKNATLVMAVRNLDKGKQVAAQLKANFAGAKLEVMKLDLSDLASIRAFADAFTAKYTQLDVLINNAGVMTCPFSKTKDGFEVQMGTNHFGTFALTGLLMNLLVKTNGSRIVLTSSIVHQTADIDFADINWATRKYNTGGAYGASKLANLYFAYELARKLKPLANAPKVSIAHPGVVLTELQRHDKTSYYFSRMFGQKVEQGVLPTLRAAFDTTAESSDFYGPNGFMGLKGQPVKIQSSKKSYDTAAALQLWKISEDLTKVKFNL